MTAAQAIRDSGLFTFREEPWHWLGHGVYFWQDAELRAFEWALQRVQRDRKQGSLESQPAVVSATISLDACLDLLDIRYWPIIDKAWSAVTKSNQEKGIELPDQIAPAEALLSDPAHKKRYGNNQKDCAAVNMAVQLLKENGTPVTTARGAFMEGGGVFDDSWLRERSHVQIAVVDPLAIPKIVTDVQIEDSARLQLDYDELCRHRPPDWQRYMSED